MDSPYDPQILLTGKVVSMTGRIEARLAECGAIGNGLHEKVESIKSQLDPEAIQLLDYIGFIRNRFAHDPNTQISEEEFALFENSVNMVMLELNTKFPRLTNPISPPSTPVENHTEIPNNEKPISTSECGWLVLAGRIPILHLAYAVSLFWKAISDALCELALLMGALLSILIVAFGIWKLDPCILGLGLALLVLDYAIGIAFARNRQLFSKNIYLIPGLNPLCFATRLLELLNWCMLLESITILFIWLAAIWMASKGEVAIAGGIAVMSYISSVIATFIHR